MTDTVQTVHACAECGTSEAACRAKRKREHVGCCPTCHRSIGQTHDAAPLEIHPAWRDILHAPPPTLPAPEASRLEEEARGLYDMRAAAISHETRPWVDILLNYLLGYQDTLDFGGQEIPHRLQSILTGAFGDTGLPGPTPDGLPVGEALADEWDATSNPILRSAAGQLRKRLRSAVLADAPAGEVTPSAGEVHNRLASNCRERPGLPFGNQTCYVCAGGVTPPADAPAKCPECGGSGMLSTKHFDEQPAETHICDYCNGSGAALADAPAEQRADTAEGDGRG